MKKEEDERERKKKKASNLRAPWVFACKRVEGKWRHGGEFKCLGVSRFTSNLC